MKGISAVIAIIMVLLLTISITGLAFLIFSRSTEDTGEDVGGFAEGQLKQLGADLKVEAASGNKVYIRNTGTNAVPNTSIAFYINDQLVSGYSDVAAIEPGQIVEFTLGTNLVDNDILTVTGGKKTVGMIIRPTTTTIGVTTTVPGATTTTIPTTPCWALTGDATSFIAYGIANDSTNMYIAGIGEGPDWRIEKRLLNDGSAVAAFGTAGVVTGPAASHGAYDIAIDGNYMYVAGSELTSSVNWRVEKRLLSTGVLDAAFGCQSNTVIIINADFDGHVDTGGGTCDATNDLLWMGHDMSPNVYYRNYIRFPLAALPNGVIVTDVDLQLNVNSITNGASADIQAYNQNGQVDPSTDTCADRVTRSADDATPYIDNTAILTTVGTKTIQLPSAANTDIQNAKTSVNRFSIGINEDGTAADNYYLSNLESIENIGSNEPKLIITYVTTPCTAGVVTGDTFTNTITSIAVDGTYMYLFGIDDNSKWRVEKRYLSNGNLVLAFGTGGIVTGDVTTALAEDISLYSTYIYLAGSDSNGDWRIEKRRADDGTLEGTFGAGGVVTGSAVTESVYAIVIDGTYMYLAGTEVSGIRNWHIEKRLLTDGSLVPAFGTSGMITGDATSYTPTEMITDSTYMYIIGIGDNNNWRIEKRRLDTGAPDASFGTSGVIRGDAVTKIGYDLLLNSNYLYAVGYDDNNNWRIEKRLATTGEISPCTGPTTTTTTTTIPSIISFVAPTDPIGTYAKNKTYINLSVTEPSVDSVWLDWNGTKIAIDSPSLIASWNFDNNTMDSSRYGNNGKFLRGNTSVCNTTLAGRFGGACAFDGMGGIINVTYSSNLNLSRDKKFTIMFWAKPFSTSVSTPIITKGAAQTQYAISHSNENGQQNLFWLSGVQYNCAVNFYTVNQWSHIAVVWDGSVMQYLNGQLMCNQFGGSPGLYTDETNLSIGGGSPLTFGNNYYRGLIDEMRIYDTNLSSTEIAAIYNVGSGKYFANITEFGLGQYVYQGFVNSTTGTQSVTEARIFTQSDCTGNVVLSTNPTSTTPGGSVTPSASSLTNCNGKTVEFRYFSCTNTVKSACTVDATGNCQGAPFNVLTTLGNQTYAACIDKNGDGDTNDFGESNGQLVSVCTNGYPDADSDSRYNGTLVTGLCSGSYVSSPPATPDCNDGDSTKYQYLTGYLDADVDTATVGESGWKSPASASNDASIGTIPWLTPANAIADDNVHSNATMSDSAVTNYLIATNFGFSLTPNATVTGIRVDIERKAETSSDVRDNNTKLIKGGVISGTNKALNTITWGNTNGINRTYGGPGDLWGETWTVADINSPAFGFAINVRNYLTTSATASIDRVRMRVYHTDGGSQVCSGASLPSGYRSTATNSDCYDNNANVWPGQATYFTVQRGDGNFDYNCDNVETKRWTWDLGCSCAVGCTALCFNPDNYIGSTPACGTSGNIYNPASYTTDAGCSSGYRFLNCNSIPRVQECR